MTGHELLTILQAMQDNDEDQLNLEVVTYNEYKLEKFDYVRIIRADMECGYLSESYDSEDLASKYIYLEKQ